MYLYNMYVINIINIFKVNKKERNQLYIIFYHNCTQSYIM